MSGIRFTVTTTEVIIPANSPKTGLQITAPSSNQRILTLGYALTFDSKSVTAEPGWLSLQRQTSIGTMTGLTPVRDDNGLPETIQSSASFNALSEPASSINGLIKRIQIHPQQGYEFIYPMGRELPIRGGERLAIVATMPDTVNGVFWFWGEE